MKGVNVFFFGSLGDGYQSFPKEFRNLMSGLSSAGKAVGTRDVVYRKQHNFTLAYYSLHGLLSEGDHSVRGGRGFGIGVKLDNQELSDTGIAKLFGFLDDALYKGLSQPSIGLFRQEANSEIKAFAIKKFKTKEKELDFVRDKFMENFLREFENDIIPINNTNSYELELDPIKIEKANKIKVEAIKPAITEEEINPLLVAVKATNLNKVYGWLTTLTFLMCILIGASIFQYLKINQLRTSLNSKNVELVNLKKDLVGLNILKPKDDSYTTAKIEGGFIKYFLIKDNLRNLSELKGYTVENLDVFLTQISEVLLVKSTNMNEAYNSAKTMRSSLIKMNPSTYNKLKLSFQKLKKNESMKIEQAIDLLDRKFLLYQK